MYYLLEIGLLMSIVVSGMRIFRKTWKENLIRFFILAASLIVGNCFFYLAWLPSARFADNLVLRGVIASTVSIAATLLLFGFLRAKLLLKPKNPAPSETPSDRASTPPPHSPDSPTSAPDAPEEPTKNEKSIPDNAFPATESTPTPDPDPPPASTPPAGPDFPRRAGNGIFNAALFAFALLLYSLIMLFLINAFVAATPRQRVAIQEHSLFLHAFLVPMFDSSMPGMPHDKAKTTDLPRKDPTIPGSLFSRAKQTIAAWTGMRNVTEYLNAMQTLSGLSPEEYLWLEKRNPPLRRLANHPAMISLGRNQEIADLAQRAAAGSISAVYELGDLPEIQALADDPTLVQAIRSIDLIELRDELIEYRHSGAREILVWQIAEVSESIEIDSVLKTPQRWETRRGEQISILRKNGNFILARSVIASPAARTLFLRCRRPLPNASDSNSDRHFPDIVVWLNDARVKVRPAGDGTEAELKLPPGTATVLVMIDTRRAGGPPSFQLECARRRIE